MSKSTKYSGQVAYRGELMVELWLQELGPEFVARPTTDFAYDFFVGFANPRGGINNIAVEVKATDRPVRERFPIRREQYNRWANSNIPVLLLVADVKQNRLYYAWPTPGEADPSLSSDKVEIHLKEIDDQAKAELRAKLVA